MLLEFITSIIIAFGISGLLGITIWAVYILKTKKSLNMFKPMTEEEYEKYIVYRKIVGIITVSSWCIVIVLVFITLLTNIPLKDPQTHDISNWTTLVIEIGLAAALGISFLVYQQSGAKNTRGANEKRRINSKKAIAFGLRKLKNHLEDCKKGILSQSGMLSTKPLTGFSDFEKNKVRFVIDQIIRYHCENAHYLLDDDFESKVRRICAEMPEIYYDIGSEYELKKCDDLLREIEFVFENYLQGYESEEN